ncbi:MAG: hypothetical protein DRJ36_00805 [Thermoprotei archaeon]|nr:MAG: hypothetical protein DRJ36_00805 [Thermoprotei archaeon]
MDNSYYKKKIEELEREIKARFVSNEEPIEALILNLLHRRSTALIRAPRGLGKSTLMLLLLKGVYGDKYVVISGASEVRRGEVVGRLHIPSLESEGIEKVVWSEFVKTQGKGLDEANRLNPYTAASIYHMLQFGEVWAYSQKLKVGDYTLIANENPHDQTTFVHPPPFYDRFDICVYLSSLSFSEKFILEDILDKYDGDLVGSMPQVLTPEELAEIRREIERVEIDVEIKGLINLLVRDLQACIRGREYSEIKPPTLCEGCHFMREICSRIREGPSERATIVLTNLVKAKVWLSGNIDVGEILKMSLWVFPHRLVLSSGTNALGELQDILYREEQKMTEREARRQWFILNRLYREFSRDLYNKAKEIALEDLVFAEEIIRLEEKWLKEGKIREEEMLRNYILPR